MNVRTMQTGRLNAKGFGRVGCFLCVFFSFFKAIPFFFSLPLLLFFPSLFLVPVPFVSMASRRHCRNSSGGTCAMCETKRKVCFDTINPTIPHGGRARDSRHLWTCFSPRRLKVRGKKRKKEKLRPAKVKSVNAFFFFFFFFGRYLPLYSF